MSGPWSSPVPVGSVLAGKYHVEHLLGVGGMGAVVAATHIDLDELRAIKLMHASESESPAAVERFLREARAAVKLKSEYIARVYDVGRLESGVPYIVMEYLDGHDLSRIARKQGPLPFEDVVHYMLQACDAISEAHSLGIVHRDLKPANLFLTRRDDGSPCIKVLDFGISKHTAPGAQIDMEITTGKEVLGSPHYMSPEQMRSTKSADARSDIWSLGAIMYRLITGRLPFPADTPMELALRIVETVPERPSALRPEIPAGLEAVILRCLEKDPAQRIQSATELASELLPFAPVDALEMTPLSRRFSRSIAPSGASLVSVVDASGAGPSSPAAPSLPAFGPEAGQGTWPSLPTPPRQPGEPSTEVSSPGTAWGATGHDVLPAGRPARQKVLMAAGAGALLFAIAAGVALSWSSGVAQPATATATATAAATNGPPASVVELPAAPAGPTAPAPATQPPAAAPAPAAAATASPATATKSAAGAKNPAVVPAKTTPTPSPRGPAASPAPSTTSKTRPSGGASDPFGRSRK